MLCWACADELEPPEKCSHALYLFIYDTDVTPRMKVELDNAAKILRVHLVVRIVCQGLCS